MNQELLRIVDSIARDKNIDKESIFLDIEAALLSAARKFYGEADDVACAIDRMSGEIQVRKGETLIDYREFGRIAAQTAKQVLIQKIRENERTSILDEYMEQKGQIISGTVSRFEGGALIVNVGRSEGFLPKSEQIPGETHNTGERIRCLLLDVRDAGNQVKIILSRSHPDFIRRLFEVEVPEVQEKVIEVKALAREAGYRTKIAVTSIDTKVDAVGACVGVRGSRIKNIVDELGGEKIDIVRWNESSQILITNALKPAEIVDTSLNFELNRATVVVNDDQLSLAIGKRGQNVRLAARLTGWDIDILTPKEYNKGLTDMESSLKKIEGVDEPMLDRMVALGIINLLDLEEMGTDPLTKELELPVELAEKIVTIAAEEAKRVATEDAIRRAAEEEAKRNTVSPLDAAMAAPAGGMGGVVSTDERAGGPDEPSVSPLAALEAAPEPAPLEAAPEPAAATSGGAPANP